MEHYNNFMNTFSVDERQQLFANSSDLEKAALRALSESASFGLQLSDSQQEIITNIFSNLNIAKRNQHYNITFSEDIINSRNERRIRFETWMESISLYYAIFGPPQLGKTEAIFDCIFTALNKNVCTILTSDNSRIQLSQMYKRLCERIEKEKEKDDNFVAPTIINMSELSMHEFNKQVKNLFERGDRRFVIMFLNNYSSISKLNALFTELCDMKEFKKYKQILKIHDEGDTTVKNDNVNECIEGNAKSHDEWIKISKLLSKHTNLKNVYVSATLDCIFRKYDIKCKDLRCLEANSNYVGYKTVDYKEISENSTEDELLDIVKTENDRVINAKSCEVIIYGVESTTIKQENVVEKISNVIGNDKTITHSYNSDKIIIKINNFEIFENFYNILFEGVPAELWDTEYSTVETKSGNFRRYRERNENRFTLPYESKYTLLRDLYDMFKKSGAYCVIAVGKLMFNRGVSVVGGDRSIRDPFTATTLITNPKDQMYMVAKAQFKGRVFGTARSELKRTIYATKKSKESFIKYNENQELDIISFKNPENSEKFIRDIIDQTVYQEGTSSNIERKKLNLPKLNIMEVEDRFNGSELSSILNDNRDIKGKIIRYLFDKNEITYEQLLVGIEYQNSGSRSDMEGLISNISNCRNYVTTRINNDTHYIKLNEQTRIQMQNTHTNF